MQISDKFKTAQKKYFQDKTIKHRARVENTGSLGSVTVSAGASLGEYLVNLQVVKDEAIAEAWGLRVGKDAFMTSADPLLIDIGDFVQYGGVVYQVQGSPAFDSHTKWLLSATDEAVI